MDFNMTTYFPFSTLQRRMVNRWNVHGGENGIQVSGTNSCVNHAKYCLCVNVKGWSSYVLTWPRVCIVSFGRNDPVLCISLIPSQMEETSQALLILSSAMRKPQR